MKLIFSLVLLFFTTAAFSQTPAFEKNTELGRGINLGNMFEAPSESAWGNPFQDEYIERIASLGFNHIRIPIRWEPDDRSMATPPYTINATFLARIQHVVDLALQHGLQVIINMHHHEALMNDPDGQKERFISMWEQITQHFSAYSDSLLFELLNEPNGNLTAEKWNGLLTEGVQAIRETDSTRFIIVGVAEYGGLGGLSKLQLPTDDRLILTIHYYNPFSFTHQGAEWVGSDADQWLGTQWNDTESERLAVQSDFAPAIQFSHDHNIPIHVGEFGAYNKADLASRSRWTTYLARYFESQNFSWAYWEFSAGFGIYNPSTKTYVQELVDALLHNPMPEKTPVNRKEIKKTDFGTAGNQEGWNLYQNGGASATGTVGNGEMTVNIQDGGTEGWHIQMAVNNIQLEQGKDYEISIRVKASNNRSISIYAGMNHDPWSAYSGYNNYGLSKSFQTFTASFKMQNESDSQARLVIDLGNSNESVTIDEIALYEVSIATNSAELNDKPSDTFFYPNPTNGIIYLSNVATNSQCSIYSSRGQLLKTQAVFTNQSINLQSFPAGQYFIQLKKSQSIKTAKLLKL